MNWLDRYDIAKRADDSSATSGDSTEVAKQLPAGVGPVVTDQSGWTTQFVDTPPKLPASNSVHYDIDATVAKAREVVADLKTTKETQ